MNIGIIIGRIGDVDGVALETEKWIEVLERMGHTVFILAGRFKRDIVPVERQRFLHTLSFFSPECEWEQNRAFFFPADDPADLLEHLEITSHMVASTIFSWVLENNIDAMLIENGSALPCHLSMGLGIKKALNKLDIPTVCHDHDFYWERGTRYLSPHDEITTMVEETFPLDLPHVKHAVINTAAKEDLQSRLSIPSVVVPNVMDFKQPFGQKDDYNHDLFDELGLQDDDIPLFQITRIVQRKGIEVAIDLIDRLDDDRVKLVITGSAADDERKGYYHSLVDVIREKKLKKRVIFAHHKILSHRDHNRGGGKIFSLSDAYAHARACTYFSTYEGFGNAFVESVLAKRPIFVNNYKPVYWPDIGSKGFKAVMLEDNDLTDEAVKEIDTIIHDRKLQKEIAEHNFALGEKLFSYEVLEDILGDLFAF
jgi:glycosyltransferase involved in cell wall biosynthesis